jgi:hypothetical protein
MPSLGEISSLISYTVINFFEIANNFPHVCPYNYIWHCRNLYIYSTVLLKEVGPPTNKTLFVLTVQNILTLKRKENH